MSLARLMVLIAVGAVLLWAWLFNRQYKDAQRAWTTVQIEALDDRDPARRRSAAYTLSDFNDADLGRVIAALSRALGDPDHDVRQAASGTLIEALHRGARMRKGAVEVEVEQATRALSIALRDRRADTRLAGARALATLYDPDVRISFATPPDPLGEAAKGPVAGRVAESLLIAMRDVDAAVRADAAAGLGGSARTSGDRALVKEAAEALERATADADPRVRAEAYRGLAQLGAEPNRVQTLVDAVLRDPAPGVRIAAMRALTEVWPSDPRVSPLLVHLWNSTKSSEDRLKLRWVFVSYRQFAPTRDMVPAMVEALDANDWAVSSFLANALLRFGPAARPALPALARTFHSDQSGYAACQLAGIMASIDANSAKAQGLLEPLVAFLTDERRDSVFLRKQAANALGQFGPSAAPVVDTLRDALKSTAPDVRAKAAFVLGRIGPAAAPARSTLVTLSRQDPDAGVRQEATNAVAGIDETEEDY